jgi:carbamoyl-phosphate synthase small subunit
VSEQKSAFLVLDDGRIFEGYAWAKHGETFGEAVFTTGMTGYQETLTDPSYHKQIVVMTAPHIGNTGVNSEDYESERIWVSGFVVRNPSPAPSNWRSSGSLEQALIDSDVVGIAGIDTRALTRHIRDRGAMRVGIFSGVDLTREEMVVRVRKSTPMEGAFLAADVSTKQTYVVKPPANIKTRFKVAAIDLGIKGATPKAMAELGIQVHVGPPMKVEYRNIMIKQ